VARVLFPSPLPRTCWISIGCGNGRTATEGACTAEPYDACEHKLPVPLGATCAGDLRCGGDRVWVRGHPSSASRRTTARPRSFPSLGPFPTTTTSRVKVGGRQTGTAVAHFDVLRTDEIQARASRRPMTFLRRFALGARMKSATPWAVTIRSPRLSFRPVATR